MDRTAVRSLKDKQASTSWTSSWPPADQGAPVVGTSGKEVILTITIGCLPCCRSHCHDHHTHGRNGCNPRHLLRDGRHHHRHHSDLFESKSVLLPERHNYSSLRPPPPPPNITISSSAGGTSAFASLRIATRSRADFAFSVVK